MVPKSSEKRVGLDVASLQLIFPRVINQLANEKDYVTLNAAALTCRAWRDVFLSPLAVLLPQLHIATDALESTVGLQAGMENAMLRLKRSIAGRWRSCGRLLDRPLVSMSCSALFSLSSLGASYEAGTRKLAKRTSCEGLVVERCSTRSPPSSPCA